MFNKSSRSFITEVSTLLPLPSMGIDRQRKMSKNLTLGELYDVIFVLDSEKTETYYPDGRIVKEVHSFPLDSRIPQAFQILRDALAKPVYPTSSYRSEAHEVKKGRSGSSQHTVGRAIDLKGDGLVKLFKEAVETENKLYRDLKAIGVNGFGVYDTFIHIDTRPSKVNNGSFYFGNNLPTNKKKDELDDDSNEAGSNNNIFNNSVLRYALVVFVPFSLVFIAGRWVYKKIKK